MMRWTLLGGALAACTAGGESSPPAAVDWNYAMAMAECAPWDGAATTVYLTEVQYSDDIPRPNFRLAVYHGLSEVPGHRWEVGLDHDREGVPSLCPAFGPCVLARDGWIAFETRSGEGPLAGRYDLTLDDGRRLAGRFVAPVLERLALCG